MKTATTQTMTQSFQQYCNIFLQNWLCLIKKEHRSIDASQNQEMELRCQLNHVIVRITSNVSSRVRMEISVGRIERCVYAYVVSVCISVLIVLFKTNSQMVALNKSCYLNVNHLALSHALKRIHMHVPTKFPSQTSEHIRFCSLFLSPRTAFILFFLKMQHLSIVHV